MRLPDQILCFLWYALTHSYRQPSEIRYIVTSPRHDSVRHENAVISLTSDAFSIKIESEVPFLRRDLLEIDADVKYFIADRRRIVKLEPGAFTGQHITAAISLRMNQLTDLKAGSFVDLQIAELHLDGNLITHIHERALENLPNLEVVDLSHNSLVEFHHEAFINTPILHELSMASNQLKRVAAEAFGFMSEGKDTVVKLEDNAIGEVSAEAFDHIDVADLNLRNNRLEELPAEIFQKNTFERLFLDDNYLRELPDEFFEQDHLREVHLTGNSLHAHVEQRLREMAANKHIRVMKI